MLYGVGGHMSRVFDFLVFRSQRFFSVLHVAHGLCLTSVVCSTEGISKLTVKIIEPHSILQDILSHQWTFMDKYMLCHDGCTFTI